ncbi:MAG: hypothetical protein Satyrvirus1_43 [Satyrvirus sp.]|uniref:Uncharacterized protein n=1 Tax=Satyrvirus sp. TaxID=2487771 RepID=A0A3G5ACS9_9VIRU|nr:MAG: hypothetical protein Satyrvirus1_43 [Satyrvirus sp.]
MESDQFKIKDIAFDDKCKINYNIEKVDEKIISCFYTKFDTNGLKPLVHSYYDFSLQENRTFSITRDDISKCSELTPEQICNFNVYFDFLEFRTSGFDKYCSIHIVGSSFFSAQYYVRLDNKGFCEEDAPHLYIKYDPNIFVDPSDSLFAMLKSFLAEKYYRYFY